MSDATGAIVLRPGEGRSIPLGTFAMSLKADAAATAGAFTLLEASEPPNFGPPMHIHHNCAEAFYVLEGEYRIFIAGREFACPAGSFIYIPMGIEHGFRVADRPSRKLNLYTPAAMEGYFEELSAALARHAATDELDAIAARNGMEITGPVPEGYV
jgi:mannose-6-phosphate isomerase-like protein (cupin superfamily)